jgi:hypothetical protein
MLAAVDSDKMEKDADLCFSYGLSVRAERMDKK